MQEFYDKRTLISDHWFPFREPVLLILTDSRGHSMGTQLQSIDLASYDIILYIMPYSGGRLADITRKGLRDYGHLVFDRIYLMGGVNNLSTLIGHFVIPKYHNKDILVRDLMIEFYNARKRLDQISAEVVVCDLIGLSFRNYNYGLDSHEFPQHQQILNSAVLRINEYIQEINEARGLHSPQLADVVHKKRGTDRIEHRYTSTCPDGLHFYAHIATKIFDKLIFNMLN